MGKRMYAVNGTTCSFGEVRLYEKGAALYEGEAAAGEAFNAIVAEQKAKLVDKIRKNERYAYGETVKVYCVEERWVLTVAGTSIRVEAPESDLGRLCDIQRIMVDAGWVKNGVDISKGCFETGSPIYSIEGEAITKLAHEAAEADVAF